MVTRRSPVDDQQILWSDSNLKEIKAYVEDMDPQVLGEKLATSKGMFGYTPLHVATVYRKHEVLTFLLDRAGNTNINCHAYCDYTPLHLAAEVGCEKCVQALLQHDADISCVDIFGKTPKQTAELSSKSSIVKLLNSEGEP